MAHSQDMSKSYFCWLLLVLFSADTSAAKLISCGTSFCEFGKPASVVCKFNTNLIESKSQVSVIRFAHAKDPGIDVFSCSWKEDPNPKCTIKPEYTWDKNIHGTLTLLIPNATKEVVGTYKCQIIPPDGTISHVCDFIVNGPRLRPENATQCTSTGNQQSPVILTAFLAIVTVALFASIGMHVYRWTNTSRRWQTQRYTLLNQKDSEPGKHDSISMCVEPESNSEVAFFILSQCEPLRDIL